VGGRGNIDEFRRLADQVAAQEPFAPYFAGWRRPWNYASPEETAARLTRAGFAEVDCWLERKDVAPENPHAYASTVCLVRHVDPLPSELRAAFVDWVLERSGEPLVLRYVRLNMTAIRP
jgi:trans-aconitate 2-methyltransferase